MRTTLLAFLIAAPSLVFAQLDSYSVTITASRTVSQQPDQVAFQVSVDTPLNAGFDDVVAALQGSGITAADFAGISQSLSLTGLQRDLTWTFQSSVAISKMTDMLASLSASARSIAKTKPGWSLTFYLGGTQVSPELQAANPCSITDLMSDARVQAQKLATAAGFQLGSVWAISPGSAAGTPAIAYAVFSTVSGILNTLVTVPTLEPCSIIVKFKLIGN